MADVVYPFKKYNFNVEIAGIGAMGFSEVSGGETSFEPVEYREGNFGTSSVSKQQGIIKYGNVILKYGLTENKALYDWLTTAQSATVEKKKVTISVLDDNHKDVKASWTLTNAIPCKLQLADFSANGNEIAVETVELACESVVRDK